MMTIFSFAWTIRLMIFGQRSLNRRVRCGSSPLYCIREQNIQCFRPYLESLMILSAQSRDDNSDELLPGSLNVSGERGAHSRCNHDCQAFAQQLKQKKQKIEWRATGDSLVTKCFSVSVCCWDCRPWSCQDPRGVSRSAARSVRCMRSLCHPCSSWLWSSPWSTTVPWAATNGLEIIASALYRFPKPPKYRWVQGNTIKTLHYIT